MEITLSEIKNHMKIDTTDDDALIETYLKGATNKVKDMLRIEDFSKFNENELAQIKIAIYYTTSYLYDFRENKDDKLLELNIRSILSNLREVKF